MSAAAIVASELRKAFGDVRALDGVDLEVDTGSVVSLLGPNGAGKTSTLRILATLLRPDAGSALVAGRDVVAEPDAVRRQVALTAQESTVDGRLTGRENLEMFGRLHHFDRERARAHANALLDRFALIDAADRVVATWSGGMRRRLDFAASLMGAPAVLLLDEPTSGLDAASRRTIWAVVDELAAAGTTVLLSTQDLAEAEALSNRVAVLDGGRMIAQGAVSVLKSRTGGARVELTVVDRDDLDGAFAVVARQAVGEPRVFPQAARVVAPVADGPDALAAIVLDLRAEGITASELGMRRPTLDEVVTALTERSAAPVAA